MTNRRSEAQASAMLGELVAASFGTSAVSFCGASDVGCFDGSVTTADGAGAAGPATGNHFGGSHPGTVIVNSTSTTNQRQVMILPPIRLYVLHRTPAALPAIGGTVPIGRRAITLEIEDPIRSLRGS